jgi:hypothetical protein
MPAGRGGTLYDFVSRKTAGHFDGEQFAQQAYRRIAPEQYRRVATDVLVSRDGPEHRIDLPSEIDIRTPNIEAFVDIGITIGVYAEARCSAFA